MSIFDMAVEAFPGRVIIDHLPKTGGQALTSWLVGELGTGCVTPNVAGVHHELIETYGGTHSIISGHVHFHGSDTLDPRYQYVTCLRDPVDRVVSWLYFVLYDSLENDESRRHKKAAESFLNNDGKEQHDDLINAFSNLYVSHFFPIGRSDNIVGGAKNHSADERLETALAAIRRYDVVGIYEDFPQYISDVANLVGLDAPNEISKVNVSTRRPRVEEISPALRERIVALNQLDIRFYSEVVEWKKRKALAAPVSKHASGWTKYNSRESPLAKSPFGSASLTSPCPSLTINERIILRVKFLNVSRESWAGDALFPINACYHWLLPSGGTYLYDGQRTPLPKEGIPPGQSVSVNMSVIAPSEAGVYTLLLTLVQERFTWLEQRGFTPAIIQVVVGDPERRQSPGAVAEV